LLKLGGLDVVMISSNKLRKNYEFKYVYNNGKVYTNNLLVMYIAKNKSDYNKVGFSVSKKVGNSVERNKVRRRIKECFRLNSFDIKKGYNIVFVSRVRAKDASYSELERAMISIFKKSQILQEER
jgi:ribonuclease P protein component